MTKIIFLATFELNDASKLEGWKQMSHGIDQSLKDKDGFISRDSAIGEDGKVYCIVSWESAEKQTAFRKVLESDPKFQEQMKVFAELVNMETMKSEILKVL